MADILKELKFAEEQTDTNPTEEQKLSGDYQKGKLSVKELPIVIENPAGSNRTGIDGDGNSWSTTMHFTYGYIDNTIGSDGDQIDVFLGPIINQDFKVYLINQIDPVTNIFDEYKVMLGFINSVEAKEAYLSSYPEGWKGFSSITELSIDDFKKWLENKTNHVNSLNLKDDKVSNLKGSEPVIKLIKLEGEVLEDVTLVDLQKQAGKEEDFDILVMEIASPGGSVYEGLCIMVWMNLLSQKGKNIVTVVTANAYSIASLIMLAANHRIIGDKADVMVHNPMVPELFHSNANELEKHVESLRDLEAIMYELYESFTGLSTEEIKTLMDNETYLNADEAIKYNFADEKAVIKQRPKSKAVKQVKKTNMLKTLNILHRVISMVNKSEIVNQLYYDDKGSEFEIFQNDPSTYKEGDRTSLENGEVRLSDGALITIENFVITNINRDTPAPAAEVPAVPVIEPAQAPAAEAPVVVPTPAVDPALEPKKEEEKPAAAFNEGPAPATQPLEPAKEEETKVEPVASTEPPVPALEPAKEDPMKEVIDGLVKMIGELKEEMTQLKSDSNGMVKKMEATEQFEKLATEAIDTIASATSSNFKPSARVASEEAPSGSIFSQMKEKRGLK